MTTLPCNGLLQYVIYMYWGGLERLGLSLAWKLGFNPVTLAHLNNISSSFPKIGTSTTNVQP